MLLMGYARTPCRNFESYLRMVVGLDEEHLLLFLKQYNSNFVPNELSPGVYLTKDLRRLFTLWVIMKEVCKLNMMVLEWKQNSFWHVLVKPSER